MTTSEPKPQTARRAWALPLTSVTDSAHVDGLCSLEHVGPDNVEPYLDKMLSAAQPAVENLLALLVEGNVRALGRFTGVTPGSFAWDQTPVDFPSPLLVNPTTKARALDAGEREKLWSQAPDAEPGLQTAPTPSTGPRYWKSPPARTASGGPIGRSTGSLPSAGPSWGDLTNATRDEFEKRVKKCAKQARVRPGDAPGLDLPRDSAWRSHRGQPGPARGAGHRHRRRRLPVLPRRPQRGG